MEGIATQCSGMLLWQSLSRLPACARSAARAGREGLSLPACMMQPPCCHSAHAAGQVRGQAPYRCSERWSGLPFAHLRSCVPAAAVWPSAQHMPTGLNPRMRLSCEPWQPSYGHADKSRCATRTMMSDLPLSWPASGGDAGHAVANVVGALPVTMAVA